jgi:hypothetical protein
MPQYPPEILDAIRLHKEHQPERSREVLSRFLVNQPHTIDALLWLAKTIDQPRIALNAVELTLSLEPENEIAKRAVVAISQQWPQDKSQSADIDLLRLTGMTESQARVVIWPFKGLNRPIGVLLDEKKIGLNDLGFAAENAYDDHLKQAARTILLTYLLKIDFKEHPKPLKYIEGRENLEYHERMASIWTGLYLGLALGFVLLVLGLDISNRFLHFTDPTYLTYLAIFIAPILYGIFILSDKSSDELVQYKVGRQGERKAIDALRALLKSPWVMVHNLEWPNRKWGDADIVLIGPGGIWVFEVKNYSSKTRNIGDRWQYKSRFGWRKTSKHPGQQARRTAMNIKDYLENHDIPIRWVQPVILWVGDENLLTVEDPAVPVWKLNEVENRIEDLWRQQRLNDEQIKQASDLFEGIIHKEIKAKK